MDKTSSKWTGLLRLVMILSTLTRTYESRAQRWFHTVSECFRRRVRFYQIMLEFGIPQFYKTLMQCWLPILRDRLGVIQLIFTAVDLDLLHEAKKRMMYLC